VTRIAFIRTAISTDKSIAYSLLVALIALVAGTLVRGALAGVAPHLTFVTYFPAVLICSLLTGWRYGLICAALSGITAEVLFPGPTAPGLVAPASVASLVLFVASCAIIIATADTLRRAIRDLDDATRLAAILNKELQHRVANMLAVVQALASQSAKGATPQTFVAAFGGRLDALAKAHKLLGRRSLDTCTLPELVDEACQAFCDGENILKSGPKCLLPGASCVPLVLGLHELCTNAVKYGALTTAQGRVEVSWSFSAVAQRVIIEWKETGGPTVSAPKRKGLGSTLLRRQPGIAEVKLSFEPAGVRCKFSIDGAEPLDTIMLPRRALA
jgi:two-component sensor histidine kinase